MQGHPEVCEKGVHVVEEQDLHQVDKQEDIDYSDIDGDGALSEEAKKKARADRLQQWKDIQQSKNKAGRLHKASKSQKITEEQLAPVKNLLS